MASTAGGLHSAAEHLRAFMSSRCVLCLARGAGGGLCEPCRADIPALDKMRCPVCSLPSPGSVPCGRCLAHPPSYDSVCAAGPWDFPFSSLVPALKYGHQLAIAPVLAHLLATRVLGEAVPDLIAPMPLSVPRLRARGFNHALEIARTMPSRFAHRIVSAVLVRQRDTAPQAGLPLDDRRGNVRGAFRCSGTVANLNIVILDDVMTTGATMDEAAKVLKAAGAASVRGWVIARTLLRD